MYIWQFNMMNPFLVLCQTKLFRPTLKLFVCFESQFALNMNMKTLYNHIVTLWFHRIDNIEALPSHTVKPLKIHKKNGQKASTNAVLICWTGDILELIPQTTTISSVYKLSPLLNISLICCPLCFPQSPDWKQMCSCLHTAECFCFAPQTAVWCNTTACAPSGWWVHFDGGPPCMSRCSTTQLMPFQYKLGGCGPTCRCYVNSSLHLFSCPAISDHVKKKWNHSAVCPPPHACCFIDCCAMPAAPCTMIFQTSAICAPVTAVL